MLQYYSYALYSCLIKVMGIKGHCIGHIGIFSPFLLIDIFLSLIFFKNFKFNRIRIIYTLIQSVIMYIDQIVCKPHNSFKTSAFIMRFIKSFCCFETSAIITISTDIYS